MYKAPLIDIIYLLVVLSVFNFNFNKFSGLARLFYITYINLTVNTLLCEI